VKLNTIDDIVDDMMFKLEPDDIKSLLNPPAETESRDKRFFYEIALIDFKRSIRNNYGLWHTHPLTERWRKEGANDLRDGVDYSIDHPDNVSGQIFARLIERLKASSK